MKAIDELEQFFKKDRQKKYKLNELIKFFPHLCDEKNTLEKTIKELEEEGKVYYTNDKYMCFPEHSNFFIGELKVNKRGIYYISKDNKIICINSAHLNGAIRGDIVLVNTENAYEKNCGTVSRIITKGDRNEVFEISNKYDKTELNCISSCKNLKVYLPEKVLNKYANGDRLVINIDHNGKEYVGEIKEYLGNVDDPDADIKLIAAENNIYLGFSEESMKQLETIPNSFSEKDLIGRRDFRKIPTFTTDGRTAKDFDDAWSIKTLPNGNVIIGVHITDVPAIIPLGSPLFYDAIKKGTSHYAGNSVFPMFPHKITNSIGSLNPYVDRLTKSILAEYTPDGKLVSYEIVPFSIIHSNCRMIYDEVNKVFKGISMDEKYYPYLDILNDLNKMSHNFSKLREIRGKVNFADSEVEFDFDKDGKVRNSRIRERGDSEIIIENLALNHNEILGTYFYNNGLPCIYRNHDKPSTEKLEQICEKLNSLGYKANVKGSINSAYSLNALLKRFSNYKEFNYISEELLRGMKRASFGTTNIGHYGLGIKSKFNEAYSQASSPMRRGGDLVMQYLIDYYIGEKEYKNINIILDNLDEYCEHFSKMERNADKFEKDVDNYLLVKSMEPLVGQQFAGSIVYMGKDKVIAQLENGARGKVNFLGDKHFRFDYNSLTLFFNDNPIKVGDDVVLKLKSANKETRSLAFKILEKTKNSIRKRTY